MSRFVVATVMVVLGALAAAPAADASPREHCLSAAVGREDAFGPIAATVCVELTTGIMYVYDERADGLHATGYWSGEGTTGSCSNFDGYPSAAMRCSLPIRPGHEVCYRATVKNGSEIRGQTHRTCHVITRPGQQPT